MSSQALQVSQCTWAEDDFTLPPGVIPLDHPEPKSGQTYIMYHGTSKEAAKAIQRNGFQRSTGGMLGPGVYLSRDFQKASRYPLNLSEHQRVVLRVKVNVGKVKKIDHKNHPDQKTWHDRGYDTAWVPPKCGMVESGLEEDCVWDPARITVMGTIAPKVVRPSPARSHLEFPSFSDFRHPIQTSYPEFRSYWESPPRNSFIHSSREVETLHNFFDDLSLEQSSSETCLCGKVCKNLHGLRIHQGKMKCLGN